MMWEQYQEGNVLSNAENAVSLVNQGMMRYCRGMGKQAKNRKKNKPPVLQSDEDFLCAFEEKPKAPVKEKPGVEESKKNSHGVSVIEPGHDLPNPDQDEDSDDFAALLDASFSKPGATKKTKKPVMPLKKRLKRYPPVEADLDLHGFTAIGAQLRAQSFISGCKQQGFFTIRIIVGRGLHSDMGPVLPDVVEDVAKEMKQQGIVLSYHWEKKKKVRSGALILYLKQFEQYD
jgi:DNA-nicking Smr family endonuclease